MAHVNQDISFAVLHLIQNSIKLLYFFYYYYHMMLLSSRSPKSPIKFDINQYVIAQMKRKMEPFFIRKHRKLRSIDNLHLQIGLPNNELIRRSEATTQRCHVEDQIQNKTKSQTINFDKQNRSSKFQEDALSRQKFESLRNKVQIYISEQKKKIEERELLKITAKDCNEEGTYHRKIITNRGSPFDYGKIRMEMDKNLRNYYSQELAHKINYQQLHKIFTGKYDQKQEAKEKGRTEEIRASSRFSKINSNAKEDEPKYKIRSKKKKRTRFYTERNRKSSIFMRAINNQLEKQKPDNVDLQFREGLVEEIYTSRRIKFRNKINVEKSRKNIYDGNLYFLKE